MEFSYNVLNLQTRLSKEDTQTQEPSSLTYTYLSDGTKVRAKVDGGFGSGLSGIDLAKIDFGARFYDPYTARWTTIDPLASKYPSVSPYTYCANDPVNKFDPDGKIVGTLLDIASVVMDTKSLVSNIKQGKVGASIVDGVSLTVDVIAAAIPVVPAGAGIAVKAARRADKVVDGAKVANKAADASSAVLNITVADDIIKVNKKIPRNELTPPSQRGKAPIGNDGKPIELHHTNQTIDGGIDEMTMTEHRGKGNFTINHANTGKEASTIDRSTASKQRNAYWKSEWDKGRFK